jgi:hypothetical protein
VRQNIFYNIKCCFYRTVFILTLNFIQSSLFSQNNSDTASEVIADDPILDSAKTAIDEMSPDTEAVKEDIPDYFLQKDQVNGLPDSLDKRAIPDSVLKTLKEDDDFWYANHTFSNEKNRDLKLSQKEPLREQAWFKTLMWLIIIGGFAAALIGYLAGSNIYLFRRKDTAIKGESISEEENDNIFEINYQSRIDKAVQAGNYRLAVRLMFLRMLKSLADKNVIQYKQELTNFEYLVQLKPSSYYNDFFRLTRNYEYAWYGDFPVNEETFGVLKNEFDRFDNALAGR